jgi:hypothetical protein
MDKTTAGGEQSINVAAAGAAGAAASAAACLMNANGLHNI